MPAQAFAYIAIIIAFYFVRILAAVCVSVYIFIADKKFLQISLFLPFLAEQAFIAQL